MKRGRTIGLAQVALVAACVLSACAKSSAGSNLSALCADVSGVRQLVADAAGGPSEAAQITRIQSLETSLTSEAMSLGAKGQPASATAAANLTVALGTWKTDISLDQDSHADALRAEEAADRIQGCGG